MTNPDFKGKVKIGYSKDVEKRRKQLSTATPNPFETYAKYETAGNLEDKKLHRLIDNLNPDLRITKNREFYELSAHEAYEILEDIATISGTLNKLKLEHKNDNIDKTKQKQPRPSINFTKCGIPIGAKRVFTEDPNITVIVESEKKVLYNDEITSLSNVAAKLKGCEAIQGSAYFTYKGKKITEIAKETQWKNCD